jgi:hypothetical protein
MLHGFFLIYFNQQNKTNVGLDLFNNAFFIGETNPKLYYILEYKNHAVSYAPAINLTSNALLHIVLNYSSNTSWTATAYSMCKNGPSSRADEATVTENGQLQSSV